jgi:hypothetical protein
MSRKKRAPTLERPTLQLENRHFSRIKHGFEVIGTWYQNEDTRWRWKPCFVILPANPAPGRRLMPCVIPLENSWMWAMQGEIGDPGHVFETTVEWFQSGALPGVAGNKKDHMRLLDAVNENLTDLIKIPPRPKGVQVSVADVVISRDGQITEREVFNDV